VNYFSGYPNPKKGKISKVYLKVRFVTNELDKPPFDLERLGQELSESVKDEMAVFLAKNPYACQAVWTECIGWLFGATKAVDSKTFVPALRLKLKIPAYVPIGIQWRTIKNENKKSYEWKEDEFPPQALHLDIDNNHATRYTEAPPNFGKKAPWIEYTDYKWG
jgi:hypothetical protein